jgi:putative membrane protein
MNRRHLLLTTSLATAGLALPSILRAAPDGKVGKHSADEWTELNRKADAEVKAIKPDSADLSAADQQLVIDMAAGGMRQLELSRIALVKATSEDVKDYARAEVAEQTSLAEKLKEIAGAKGLAIPETPDEKTRKALDDLSGTSAADFDETYLKTVGIEGHEMLALTMGKVQTDGGDPALRQLAMAALPLIAVHLQAARDEKEDKG